MARQLDFPVFDADNHFYETIDAFTRYLPAEYAEVIKYVEVKGRTKLAIKNRITDYIPNPTFNVVAPPGADELKYKLQNPDSVTKPGDKPLQAPPRSIPAPPAFFEPEARIELMNELGIDRALMWPTLASVLEERLVDDPVATHVLIHAFNQWLLEHWSFNVDGRIFPVPVVTLPIVDRAIAELEWLVERGAKVILIRPAPVPDFNGRRRSFALPEFDPFWKRVQEADVLVGMHASDSGTQPLRERVRRPRQRVPSLRGEVGVRRVPRRRDSDDRRRGRVDHRARHGDPVPEAPDPAGRERQRLGPAAPRRLAEGLRAEARALRRGSGGRVQAEHLGPPVPRGGLQGPHRPRRRRQRLLRVGLSRTRKGCTTRSPTSTTSRACPPPNRRRSWAATSPRS